MIDNSTPSNLSLPLVSPLITPTSPAAPSPLIRNERTDTEATPQDDGNSVLALLFAKALKAGATDDGFPENIDNIPKTSTFGQWWSVLHNALKSPPFLKWALEKGIDLSKPMEISPARDSISFTVNGKMQKFSGPDQGHSWAEVTGPIMRAAEVLSPERKPLNLESAHNSTSAPFEVVAHFHNELHSTRSMESINTRAAELEQSKTLRWIPGKDSNDLASESYSTRLQNEATKLGDAQNKYLLARELLPIILKNDENSETYKDLMYRTKLSIYERRRLTPEAAKAQLQQNILNALKNTTISVNPDSAYAKSMPGNSGTTVSLEKFITDNGWTIPKTTDEIVNFIDVLISHAPKQPSNGNFGGAMDWPIPLSGISPARLTSSLTDKSLGLSSLDAYDSNKGVLDYLTTDLHFSTSQLRHPRKVIEDIIGSRKGEALGKALQDKFGGLSTPTSVNDWTLAAIHATLDPESTVKPSRTRVAGFDLADAKQWGKHPSEILQNLAYHLSGSGRVSHKLAPVAAHLLMARRAPEFLVRDIPANVTYGSHSWVSFSTAVARIEAERPGASSTLTYGEIMARAERAPISVADQATEYSAQTDALKDWGVANGIISRNPEDTYTETQMTTVRAAYDARVRELSAASQAQATPMPSRKEMALQELKRVYGDKIPFEKKCISSFPEQREYPGPYSVVDLYLEGRLLNPPGFDWHSSDSNVSIRPIQVQAGQLKDVNKAFKEELPNYFKGMKQAVASQVKHLISTQPLEVRKDFEFGAITVMRADELYYENQYNFYGNLVGRAQKTKERKNNNLLIRTRRNGKTRTYEIDMKRGSISQTAIGSEPGYYPPRATEPHTRLVEIKPTGTHAPDIADSKPHADHIPDNFSSERTRYIAQAFVDDANIEKFEKEATGLTTFESEVPFYKKGREAMLNLIPLRSAISNFQKGKIEAGAQDLVFDVFGFSLALGAAAKSAKVLQTGASWAEKAARAVKIVGRAAIGSLNPLGALGDAARLAQRGAVAAGGGLKRLYTGLSKADTLAQTLKPGIAQGTLKAANGIDDISVIAKLDETTGNWHALDPRTQQAYGLPLDNFQPKVLGTDELKKNIDHLYKSLDKKTESTVCHSVALRVAQADKKITEKTFQTLLSQTSNPVKPLYYRLMGVSPDTLKNTLNAADITESGVVTFVNRNGVSKGEIAHSAYIHKADNGELTLLHNNQLTLDLYLAGKSGKVEKVGSANAHRLGDEQFEAFRNFLNAEVGFDVTFTPASQINARVMAQAS
ncbi:hypothetical protein [Pseudomonas rhodesiae]|uniref:hypothetical protein n=1 Tax=Pseudomonas rhodesiae TaxID=76760 RepID=UPI0024DF7A9B|nr:hypothetical protein [Pseudomonas rhodesiae]WHT78661.1 hypothetical protein QMY54_03452 [Pseudomonas rhodesiae]